MGERWILLIHHIPPKPDYFRVKVRRRLQRIGAVALKNSVYVLPQTDDALEDFQWVRRMVVDEGGEAMLCTVAFIDGVTDQEVEAMFRSQSDTDYGEIIDAAETVAASPTDADLRRLRRQLAHAAAHDFFQADRAVAAQRAVRETEQVLAGGREGSPAESTTPGTAAPQGATWVTRAGVKVDRIASAWLIRRFIDARARFKFVPPQGYRPEQGELRFDMFEGEFTHEGDDCTFEVLMKRFVPDDAGVRAIAEIVHDVDCKDEKFGREEAAGVASMIRGIAAAHDDDLARVEAGGSLFDGLYAAFRPSDS
jgi:hypothetical protein